MSTTNGPKSCAKSGCSVIHLYISKSATFTLTFKLFLTEEAFHYTSTNHDNQYVSEFNDSSICHRRAKMNHNKKNHQNQISSFQDIAFQNFGRH